MQGLFVDGYFKVTFSSGEHTLVKEAKTEKELWRIINVYQVGTQAEKKKNYQDILNSKEHGTL